MVSQVANTFLPVLFWGAWPRPAWNNDLQGGWLKNGVLTGAPGRPLVERPWAWLTEEVLIGFGAIDPKLEMSFEFFGELLNATLHLPGG